MLTSSPRRTAAGLLAAGLIGIPVSAVPATSSGAGSTRDPEPVAPFEPRDTDPPELREAWVRWKGLAEDDYVTRVRLVCFCVPLRPTRTVVTDGETVRVERMTDPPRELDGKGFGMDRLFHLIRRWDRRADRVEVDYDQRGVPVLISIDPDHLAVDEERTYQVRLKQK